MLVNISGIPAVKNNGCYVILPYMAKKKAAAIDEYHLNRYQPAKDQLVIYDLQSYIRKNKENTTRPHIHSYYQIIWFQSGRGTHFVDFKPYEVPSDCIFFIAKNQVHYFDDNINYTGYLLHFNESCIIHTDSEVAFFLKCNFFNNLIQSPCCAIDERLHTILANYIAQIVAELCTENGLGRTELLRGYLKAFLIQVQRFKNNHYKPALVTDEKRLQLLKFINLVDEHYKEGLSVAGYANLLHISTRTLSDVTGMLLYKTPSQMIQERMIIEAQRLLLHSELNINQVGYRLGFEDASYFVKYFKKHTGIAPTDFRKSIS